jgi:hypothetical protein
MRVGGERGSRCGFWGKTLNGQNTKRDPIAWIWGGGLFTVNRAMIMTALPSGPASCPEHF